MTQPPRILLVQDKGDNWLDASEVLANQGLLAQTVVVRDEREALDCLQSRGEFKLQPPGVPNVVLIGAGLAAGRSLALLERIRTDPKLRFMPVVMMVISRSAAVVNRAYELCVNGIVVQSDDSQVNTDRLSVICSFWALRNVPPPAMLRQTESKDPQLK